MKLPDAMRQLFDCDIAALRAELEAMPPGAWDIDGARQALYPQHQHTRSIRLAWLSNSWQREEPLGVSYPGYAPEGLRREAWPIADRLAAHFHGQVVKLMLAELKSGGRIAPHVDLGDSLTLVHRCHVPVVTNDRVQMMIGGAQYRLEAGYAYEFDNTRWHGVVNDGEEARVHLICDVLEHGIGMAAPAHRPAGATAWALP